jgi:hypothetical protein
LSPKHLPEANDVADTWYYLQGDEQCGPVPREKVAQLLAAGELARDELVWTDGMADWLPAYEVPGLVAALPHPAPQVRPAQPRASVGQASTPPAAAPAVAESEYEEDDEDEAPAGMSAGAIVGIICGSVALLIAIGAFVIILPRLNKSAPSEVEKTAEAKTGGEVAKRAVYPKEEFRVIDFDASSISDAKEKEWYELGKKVGERDVDDYLKGKRPPDDQIRKQVQDWLKERDVAVFAACRHGERDRAALLAYGRRDGVKAGIAKHKLPMP